VLSGLLLNVALYAVVRCKVLVEGSVQTSFAKELMMGFGCCRVVAAFLLSRQKDIKRLFAYSRSSTWASSRSRSAWGGRSRISPELLHMTVHSLTKSAIFFTSATRRRKWERSDGRHPRAHHDQPADWLGLVLGSLAILGMPPFGVFATSFLVLTTAMREQPWATPFLRRRSASRSRPCSRKCSRWWRTAKRLPLRPSMIRSSRTLALVLMLGLWIPRSRRLVPAGGAP